jgi:Flp pilus assembly CpaF family ATPase
VEDRLFEGEDAVLHVIERIVGPLGLRVDQASPGVDARLPGGSECRPDEPIPDSLNWHVVSKVLPAPGTRLP